MEALKLYAVTRVSPVSGRQHVLQLLMTPGQWEQIQPWIDRSLTKSARSLQDILPDHSPQEREFILSGTTQQEWDELFGAPKKD
jgi:hypothetical protein